MALPSGRCAHHPERAGIALCVACKRTICAECSTPVDGIHRCAHCLAGIRTRAVTARAIAPEWGAGNVALTLAFLVLASLAALVASYLASP